MLASVVFVPVPVVPSITPLTRSSGQAKPEKDRPDQRRPAARGKFQLGGSSDGPSGDRAMATSSAAVLSALLDLPRGG